MNDREARNLRRLNAMIDGLWVLDTMDIGTSLKTHFTPCDLDNGAVWEHLDEFSVVAGRTIAHIEPLLDIDFTALRMHQLTIQAVRWYDDLIADIAPVEAPQQVQSALIAAATYQLALRKAGAIFVDLEDVTNHVWRLCFGEISRSVVGRMDE